MNRSILLEKLNNLEKTKNYSTRNPGNLQGIDKILIINLRGSIRENNMRYQLNKLGNLVEGEDYEFIRPINPRIDDFNLSKLFDNNIFNNDKLEKFTDANGNKMIGTMSLSMITYYIYLKSYLENKIFMIFEDNIEFERNFMSKYNTFYNSLPCKNWWCLDLHTTNNHGYYNEYQKYYESLRNKLNINFTIPESKVNGEWRPVINRYTMLGCYEDGGAKAYVIKPNSFLFINELPIVSPADGIKAKISGWWNNGLSFVSRVPLIRYTDKYSNDRRNIDANIITNEYLKLDEEYVKNIYETVLKFDKYQEEAFENLYNS